MDIAIVIGFALGALLGMTYVDTALKAMGASAWKGSEVRLRRRRKKNPGQYQGA